MFANCQLGGMNFAAPDVCKTPAPPAPFVPIPYPNMAMGLTAIPNCFKVMIMAMPAHNLLTKIPISNGDNPGVMGGLISQVFMGPSSHLMGSLSTMYCGLPATKMTSPTGQNGLPFNAPGMTVVPSQTKVIIMK